MSAHVFVDGGWIAVQVQSVDAFAERRYTQTLTVEEALVLASDLVRAAIGDGITVTDDATGERVPLCAVLVRAAKAASDAHPEPMPAAPNGTDYGHVG